MKKTIRMKYLLPALAALAGGIALPLQAQDSELVSRFGHTCFTQDADKRTRADLLMQQYAEKSPDLAGTMKRLEALNAATAIGHPGAFQTQCRLGNDKDGPPALVAKARAWCALGLSLIPSLAATLDASYANDLRNESKGALRDEIARSRGRLCVAEGEGGISDEAVYREYERYKAQAGDKEYKVAHILVNEKMLAEQLIDRLNKGESFADLAMAYSRDPGSAKRGGDLGWATPSLFVPPFAAAVERTAAGTYSAEPVKSPFGWHVVKVDSVRAMRIPSFEELKESIRAEMLKKQGK